jgi:hypothetical protein
LGAGDLMPLGAMPNVLAQNGRISRRFRAEAMGGLRVS